MSGLSADPMAEIEAMRAIAEALEGLDQGAHSRVLSWAHARYGGMPDMSSQNDSSVERGSPESRDASEHDFESAPELMSAAEPTTDAERVLVTSYWFQEMQGAHELDAQVINKELKHQGHGVKNITSAFNSLMNQSPQLVIQLRKSGNTKQARKKYKLTTVGVRKVKEILARSEDEVADQ